MPTFTHLALPDGAIVGIHTQHAAAIIHMNLMGTVTRMAPFLQQWCAVLPDGAIVRVDTQEIIVQPIHVITITTDLGPVLGVFHLPNGSVLGADTDNSFAGVMDLFDVVTHLTVHST